jgi:hypothetical protein
MSAAKWLKVPPGNTSSGTLASMATRAAAATVPSPPHTASTSAPLAACRSSPATSAPRARVTTWARGSSRRSTSPIRAPRPPPECGLTTATTPRPSCLDGCGTCQGATVRTGLGVREGTNRLPAIATAAPTAPPARTSPIPPAMIRRRSTAVASPAIGSPSTGSVVPTLSANATAEAAYNDGGSGEDGVCNGTRLTTCRHRRAALSVARWRTSASAATTEATPRRAVRRPRRRPPIASTRAIAHHGQPASRPPRIAGIHEPGAQRASVELDPAPDCQGQRLGRRRS